MEGKFPAGVQTCVSINRIVQSMDSPYTYYIIIILYIIIIIILYYIIIFYYYLYYYYFVYTLSPGRARAGRDFSLSKFFQTLF